MYAYITGDIAAIEGDHVILENNGIGYDIAVSLQTVSRYAIGDAVRIYTRYIVREDAALLYGFYDVDERDLFDLLTKVSAVGPKSALSILSALSVGELVQAVRTQNLEALTRAPGIGKKTASRILLELTDALDAFESAPETVTTDVVRGEKAVALQALINLGYQRKEAESALAGLDPNAPLEQVLRTALARLAQANG